MAVPRGRIFPAASAWSKAEDDTLVGAPCSPRGLSAAGNEITRLGSETVSLNSRARSPGKEALSQQAPRAREGRDLRTARGARAHRAEAAAAPEGRRPVRGRGGERWPRLFGQKSSRDKWSLAGLGCL